MICFDTNGTRLTDSSDGNVAGFLEFCARSQHFESPQRLEGGVDIIIFHSGAITTTLHAKILNTADTAISEVLGDPKPSWYKHVNDALYYILHYDLHLFKALQKDDGGQWEIWNENEDRYDSMKEKHVSLLQDVHTQIENSEQAIRKPFQSWPSRIVIGRCSIFTKRRIITLSI